MASQTVLYDVNLDNIFNGFVAAGGAATRAETSPDGLTWTARTWTGHTGIMQNMAFGNNVLVCVANNANTANMIYTSIAHDAIPTARTHAALGASIGWYDVAFGNNTWTAVAGGAVNQKTGTSTNSIDWTINSTALTSSDYRCIAFGEGIFVSLAYNTGSQNCSDYVRYSSDGVTWSNGSGLPKAKWRSICYDPVLSKFIAVSQMPLQVIADSTTTIQFTAATKRITRGSGNFTTDTYFVGGTIQITGSSSNDGIFTIAAVGTTTMDVNETVVDEASSSTEVITPIKGSAYSDDGITWSVGSPSSYLFPQNWVCVASNGLGRVMAISNTANRDLVAYSDDGINWTSVRLPLASTWYSIAYGNGTWVAICTSYAAFSKDNGLTWSIVSSGAYAFNAIKWIPFPIHTGDTLTIDRGATVTCNTDQRASLATIAITNGKLRVANSSTSTAIRFVMSRISGSTAHTITPASGLGSIEVEGNWIELGEGNGNAGQTLTLPYTDYVSCLWVETGDGTNEYEIWLNISGAYGGTLKQYANGFLDVSTGQRGKFFTQTPSSDQDKYVSKTATFSAGLMTVTLNSTTGLYQGASVIAAGGIPANTVIEQIVDGTTIKINNQPTLAQTSFPLVFINPLSSQFTNQVVFGNGINGNVLANGVKVRIPNIMLTSDTNANLWGASSWTLGIQFVMAAGGKLSLINCLLDEVYFAAGAGTFTNQTQRLYMENVGLHIRPLYAAGTLYSVLEIYDLTMKHIGMGMPATRRYLSSGVWVTRDIRDTQTASWSMQYVTGAVLDDIAMVLQSPSVATAGTLTAPLGMLVIANSDSVTVSNVRMYSLNTIRAYHYGLAFPAAVTNSTFTNIEYYGGPMMSLQYSSNNTFTNLTTSETMFSYAHTYTAGTRVTYDPNTQADMVIGTPYYFKSRTFYTRDRVEYADSRFYSATPFKGSTYFPDYITAYVNAPQSVTFGWTHRTPMYTSETSPANNANAKNFLEIYRDTTSVFDKTLAKKVAGFNVAPSMSIPTKIVWATDARTLTLACLSVSASGGRTMTFNHDAKTIVCSSGSFISDGFVTGDKIAITGTSSNNRTYTIDTVAASTITCTDTSLVDEVASATAVLTTNKITASSGSFVTDGFTTGDAITIRGSTSSSNNLDTTITNVTATVINVAATLTTQTAYSGNLFITAKYVPTAKIYLTASAGRSIKFDNAITTATLTFGGTVALPSTAPTMTASGGRTLSFTAPTTIGCSSGSFITDGFLTGDKIYITGTSLNNTMPGNYFTIAGTVNATSMTVTAANDLLQTEGPLSSTATIKAMRTTISRASGSFVSDNFIVGDKVFVSGTTYNNTIGGNCLTVTAVAATMLTFGNDFVFPESVSATLTANRITGGSGSFLTDGYTPCDIVVVSGSANAGNNKTFTIQPSSVGSATVFSATVFNVLETLVTNAAETSGATLTVKTMPQPKVVYLNSSPNREIAFQKTVAQASANRIMTFNAYAKTITATGVSPGNFITDGFIVGDKVIVTNTTYNNKYTLTLTAVTATVLTASAATERQFDEVSTTATLTANRIKASTGSFVNDGWVIGDLVTVVGTSSNNGTYTINNVVTLALTLTSDVVNETLSYRTGAVITATKQLSRQIVYGTAARTFAVAAATKTITLSSGSMLQDGYIVGDKVLVNGMSTIAGTTSDGNNIYTVGTLTATVLTFLDPATPTAHTLVGNTVSWIHTGQRPSFTTTAATINLSWSTLAKTLSFTSSTPASNSWDYASAAYNFKVNDRIFITGQKWNNGIFTITRLLTKAITASASRTLQWTAATKTITQAGAGVINFDTEGYLVGDKIIVAGTTNNNGLFTISAVGTTTLTVWETLVNEGPLNATANMSGSYITVSEPVIPDTTVYNATAGTTCTVYGYHNPQKVTVTASAGRTLTINNIGKSITASSGNFILDGYAFGDCIQISNTPGGLNDGYYTISAITALVIYVNEQLYGTNPTSLVYSSLVTISAPDIAENTDYYYVVRKYDDTGVYSDSQPIHVKSTPQELQHNLAFQGTAFTNAKVATLNSSAARTLTFTSTDQTITASSGSFVSDGHIVGDRIYVAGTTNNNGWYSIVAVTALTMRLQQSLVSEGPLSSIASISNIYWQNLKIPVLTASTIRTIQFTAASKIITLAGTTPGSFVTDGYAAGDRLVVAGTTNNNTTFTIKSVDSATQITVYEAVVNEGPLNSAATISNTLMTIGAATRISPYVNFTATQTAEALLLTSLTDNATITQAVPMAIGNTYTFSIWVCTNPVVQKLSTLTASAVRTLTFNSAKTITVAGTSPGSFVYDGYQIGDTILIAGTTSNNGWFTIANVTDTVITVNETVVNEGPLSATATITNYFNGTLSVSGSISLGTSTQAFTATAAWQRVSVSFTATTNLHLAVFKINTMKRGVCAIGAMINIGSSALPYITTTTAPAANINKVRDISLARTWCRGLGEAASHSGVEFALAAANTGEMWTEICCGTTSDFTPSVVNRVLDTSGTTTACYTFVFNQVSQYNTIDYVNQAGIGAATNAALVYFANTSSGNKIKNLTYNIGGALMAALVSFNSQSNDTSFYNWSINNWRNYATTAGNVMIFPSSNATSGLIIENMFFNNSDFPIQNLMLNCTVKGMGGGNVKPLNSALFNNMPVTPVYVLGGGATNYDSIATTSPTVYTTEYDTIFNELYFTSTTGALSIVFNASAKTEKPYTLSGTASFSNNGRLYLRNEGDSIEYTWPHTILGISGFRNIPLLLNGVDFGNTPSLLEGLLVEYKIDTGSGYPVSWTTANASNLSAETVSATDGFNLKIKITAKLGMKYASAQKNFVIGETIKGVSSLATATVDADFDLITQGTLWLSNVTGTFTPGEGIIKESNGELRATNVATNTYFAVFPSVSSYIDGLQIYTNIDQTAKYPPERQTFSLTGLQPNSEVRIYSAGTTTELMGIENSGTTLDYKYVYSAGTYIDIVILHLDYNYYKIENYLLSNADASIPIVQITDRVYENS